MTSAQEIKYLALGDSYTVGEAVEEKERWPQQLAAMARSEGVELNNDHIIATTGWTTGELLEGIAAAGISNKRFDLVSLLIGVNNQYRGEEKGYHIEDYQKDLNKLFTAALSFVGKDPTKMFVVSIPDWGVTTFARERNVDADIVAKEIDAYNNVMRRACEERGILFFDITQASREARSNADLLASDGLHPSGKMYAQWAEQVWDTLKQRLK